MARRGPPEEKRDDGPSTRLALICAVGWTLIGVVIAVVGLVDPSVFAGMSSDADTLIDLDPRWNGVCVGSSNIAIGLFCVWAIRR